MILSYLNYMYKSIKSSYKASFCVEIAFGQNALLCNFIWPRHLWPNVRPPKTICPHSFDVGAYKNSIRNSMFVQSDLGLCHPQHQQEKSFDH